MSLIYAVDPGLRQCGLAVFHAEGKTLIHGVLVRSFSKDSGPNAWRGMAKAIIAASACNVGDIAVFEFPKVYTAGKQKGDSADLLELAAVDGELSARFEVKGVTCQRYFPHEWKRQLSKEMTKARILERLTESEKNAVSKDDHNVWDAVGIGLFFLGRFDPKKVYAR
jgi:hypothetical protein